MKEILTVFLRLGTFGFGGPVAMIGYMEEECVHRRKWMSAHEFHKTVAVCKLFPGPLATLIAIRLGTHKAGRLGGALAATCLILPAFLMILGLAQVTSITESMPALVPLWAGLTVGALAISFLAVVQLSKPLFLNRHLPMLTLISLILINAVLTFYDPPHEALYLIATGFLGIAFTWIKTKSRTFELFSGAVAFTLFYSCVKASFLTFGSGIAIVPVLKAVFVDEHHWISNDTFLKSLTLGQITPGPLVILGTYLGYVILGFAGAVITTVGTFLPTFFLGLFVVPAVEKKLLQNETLQIFFHWLLILTQTYSYALIFFRPKIAISY